MVIGRLTGQCFEFRRDGDEQRAAVRRRGREFAEIELDCRRRLPEAQAGTQDVGGDKGLPSRSPPIHEPILKRRAATSRHAPGASSPRAGPRTAHRSAAAGEKGFVVIADAVAGFRRRRQNRFRRSMRVRHRSARCGAARDRCSVSSGVSAMRSRRSSRSGDFVLTLRMLFAADFGRVR